MVTGRRKRALFGCIKNARLIKYASGIRCLNPNNCDLLRVRILKSPLDMTIEEKAALCENSTKNIWKKKKKTDIHLIWVNLDYRGFLFQSEKGRKSNKYWTIYKKNQEFHQVSFAFKGLRALISTISVKELTEWIPDGCHILLICADSFCEMGGALRIQMKKWHHLIALQNGSPTQQVLYPFDFFMEFVSWLVESSFSSV